MTQPKTSNAGAASKKTRRQPLYIMVLQRLAEGHGPGPIRVVKKLLKDAEAGSMVKKVRAPLELDHQLPAGTCSLTASDKRVFAEQGLSGAEIAYVESKLSEKKVKSDAHKAAFEAGKAQRLRESLKERLIAQLTADPQLAADVMSALGGASTHGDTPLAPVPATQRVITLSDKVSRLLALVDEVGRDIEAYKGGAKVGKTFDKDKLRLMLSREAEQDWKLAWFAFSWMVDKATGTLFARKKGWASDEELSKLAAVHGYASASAAQ